MEGGWFDEEAIEQERFDADIMQAQFEEEGRRYAFRQDKSRRLANQDKFDEAALACPHGSGYPLDSLAAKNNNDPNAGEEGYRCTGCGSRLSSSPWDDDYTILVPCELRR